MAEFPAMPLWTGAFIADTTHLTAAETGAYIMLLLCAWRRQNCDLPMDDKTLAKLARCTPAQWKRIKNTVLQFWTVEDGFFKQKKLSNVKENVSLKSQVAKRNAKARWLKNKGTGNADASDPQCYLKPKPKPVDKKEDNPPIVPPKGKFDLDPEKGNADGRKREKRGTRLSPDWRPDEIDIEYAQSRGFSDEYISDLADRFRDFWCDLPGAKAVKLDWRGTWRNKCRSEAASNPGAVNQGGAARTVRNQSGPASFNQACDNVLARIERAASGEGDRAASENLEGQDCTPDGGAGRHGDPCVGLWGGVGSVSGGHSQVCLEGVAEEIEMVPGLEGIARRS